MSEIQDLAREYGDGKYRSVERDLEAFVSRYREEILGYRDVLARRHPTVTDESAIKLYIQRIKTLNPAAEIRDQIDEIRAECWIRGEKQGGPVSLEEVARDWARCYSPGWRDHRVLVIVYCVERIKDRLLPLLANPQAATPR